jgi:hypothetical protein
MKKAFFLLLLAGSFSAVKAQSLKEMLYGGRLKNDSNSVVKRSDDLSTKVADTAARRQAMEMEKAKPVTSTVAAAETSGQPATVRTNTPAQGTSTTDTAVTTSATTQDAAATENAVEPTPAAAPVKSNSKIWKERTDALVKELQAEVLSNKKVKKETYYITVEYEIETDGQVAILNVLSAPENEFLANQVKDRLLNNAPVLAPVTDSAGKARKVKRKQNFSVTKE